MPLIPHKRSWKPVFKFSVVHGLLKKAKEADGFATDSQQIRKNDTTTVVGWGGGAEFPQRVRKQFAKQFANGLTAFANNSLTRDVSGHAWSRDTRRD